MKLSDIAAKAAARFIFKVVNEIAAMEDDDPGTHIVLGIPDEREDQRPFGFCASEATAILGRKRRESSQ